MPWFLVAIFAVSFIATILLAPKPRVENARASSLDDLRFPRASEGAVIPLVLGRGLIRGPNTLWVGDFAAVPIKKKQKTGLFSSKTVVIGYTYFIGLDMGLCLGPVTLHSIRADKDTLWTGTATTDGALVSINLPNLYGGREKGGGIVATCRFYTGSLTQGVNAYLEGQIGAGDVPAYRGTARLVIEKGNIGEANNLRPWWFEVSQYTNTLGLPGGRERIGDDVNPMEALYVAFTLEFGGLDVPADLLDVPSMIAAGEVLFNEGNGISLIISTPNSGKDIANEVLRQVDGIMYQDPLTGKMVMKLIRPYYVVDDLPVLDESNILVVRQFTSKSWEDTINQVRATYTNRDKGYEQGVSMVQDMANINAQGRIRSMTQSYPGVSSGALATALATRDMAQASVPLMGVSLETNRRAAQLRPGDPFVWAWDAFGIERVVMRVKSFDLGALNNNRISLECTQDEFAVNQTVFAAPSGDGSSVALPDDPATAATTRLLHEAPYFIAAAAGLAVPSGFGLVLVGAVPPAASVDFDAWTSLDTVTYTVATEGLTYTPTGLLKTTIAANSNLTAGGIASLVVQITTDELTSVSDISSGAGMFLVNGELFAHLGVTDNGDGTYTLADVRRALLDTPAQAHSIDDRIWFLSGDNVVEDPVPSGAAIRVKLTPRTFRDVLDVAIAPFDSLALTSRAQQPLVPGLVRFDAGAAFAPPPAPDGPKVITWANRSRLAGVVLSIVDATSVNEAGQETIIRHRVNGGSWVETVAAPGVTTATITPTAIPGDTVDWELYSRRDGLLSRTKIAGAAGGTSMVII